MKKSCFSCKKKFKNNCVRKQSFEVANIDSKKLLGGIFKIMEIRGSSSGHVGISKKRDRHGRSLSFLKRLN